LSVEYDQRSFDSEPPLLQVYTTLAAAVLLSAVGVYVHTLLHIGGIITSIGFIGASTWLAATPSYSTNEVCICDSSGYLISDFFAVLSFDTLLF
jgi:hypothetical protein